jgi:hypothetical protein
VQKARDAIRAQHAANEPAEAIQDYWRALDVEDAEQAADRLLSGLRARSDIVYDSVRDWR